MAHVRRTPNGTWEARYRATDGRERSKRFPTKRAARNYLDRVGNDRQLGTWTDPAGGRITYAEWIGRWMATEVSLRPSSRVRDESYLRTHLLPRFGPIRLGQIGHFDVRELINDLTDAGLAPATVHKAHQILNKSLRAAVEARLIPLNPAERAKLPRIERQEMRSLDPAEIHRLAAAVPDRYRAMIVLNAYAGFRLGELAGLRRRRLDLVRQQVRVAEIAVEVKGGLTFGPPKTDAGTRTVPIPKFVAEALAHHLDRYVADDPDAHVFAGAEGGALRARAWRQRVWVPAIKAADVAPLRPHDLRHTAVSLWIAAGASPKQIAVWAGHTSVSIVLDRYGHLFPGNAEPVLEQLERLAHGS
ncbi:MAG: Site-specific recombinase XerD [Acidimicrobiales bacterium]|nr:Site-specific recombinase XerD [Acidimicrobiales bacterium]